MAQLLLAAIIINGGLASSAFDLCGLAPYEFENDFDVDGRAITDFGNQPETGSDIVVQPDGKVILAGRFFSTSYDFGLVRYNPDGSVDTTFGTAGNVKLDFSGRIDEAYSVALQSNGKIVVAGKTCLLNDSNSCDFAMARFNTNGTRDLGFGVSGRVTTDFGGLNDRAVKVAIQLGGKILVAGQTLQPDNNFYYAIARYNAVGSLDTTFSGDGKAAYEMGFGHGVFDFAIQPDEKIVMVGERDGNFGALRILSNGFLDRSFGTSSRVSIDFSGDIDIAHSIALQPDGKIVLGGSTQPSPGTFYNSALVRLNTNGTLDNSFDGDGRVTKNINATNDGIADIVIRPNGDIVSVGNMDLTQTFFVGSYNPKVANSFNPHCPVPEFYVLSTRSNDLNVLNSVFLHADRIYAGGTNFASFPGDFMVVALHQIIDL